MMDALELTQKIRVFALRTLARKSWSVQAFREKLEQKFPAAEREIASILEEFAERNWLNDEMYAEEYLRYRQQTAARGKFALRRELQQKGIAPEVIATALQKLSEDAEQVAALQLARQKLTTFSEKLEKSKQKEKLFRFLIGRGFSKAVIFRVLAEVLDGGAESS